MSGDMEQEIEQLEEKISDLIPKFKKVKEEIQKVVVGQEELVGIMLVGLLADGHILLEGVPGLAKTLSVNTLAKVIDCDFKRIQFTPDLLPADLIGTTIYHQEKGEFSVKKGPVFTNILLADEINRAPAKVQSALLEVMQEKQVTMNGETFKTGNPFMVLATQNPIEQEGTYVLPEAQTDRFMLKILIDYPTIDDERVILDRMAKIFHLPEPEAVINGDDVLEARDLVDQVYVDDKVRSYVLDIVFATRFPDKYDLDLKDLIQFGASPRATLALILTGKAYAFLHGRGYVTPQDIKTVSHAVLRHRIRRTYEAEAEEISSDEILKRILQKIDVP